MNRGWKERVMSWFIGAHKYRCFICGHVFMGQFHTPGEKSREDS